MRCRIIFHDLAEKWEEEIESEQPLTCREAAAALLARRGLPPVMLEHVIYFKDQARLMPDRILSDGECITVRRLLGGG